MSRLIYRDIKPENIGFDIRGDVKVFDFGLCKNLDRDKKAEGYGYKLTPTTGSIPFMAPEVAKGLPYDTKADVFSFSLLLWGILNVDWAFHEYSIQEYFVRVIKYNERPPLKRSWPTGLRTLLQEAWNQEPQTRPCMAKVGTSIRIELERLTHDNATFLHREQDIGEKSNRSFRINKRRSSPFSIAGRRPTTEVDKERSIHGEILFNG